MTKSDNYFNKILYLRLRFYIYKKRCQNVLPSFIPLQSDIEKYYKFKDIFFTKTKKINWLNGRCGAVYLKELNNFTFQHFCVFFLIHWGHIPPSIPPPPVTPMALVDNNRLLMMCYLNNLCAIILIKHLAYSF